MGEIYLDNINFIKVLNENYRDFDIIQNIFLNISRPSIKIYPCLLHA